MKPYDWMVTYTPQTEWIEGRGLLLWLAFYTGGLGGGLYLVSSYYDSFPGMVVSWLIVAILKGGFHLAYLGKPMRFWRIIMRPQTSWVSRGFLFVGGFIVIGIIQLLISFYHPGSLLELFLRIVVAICAFCEAVYTGFAMNYVNGIPFWNSALVPVLFILYGLLGGFALLMGLAIVAIAAVDLIALEEASRFFMVAGILLLVIYLWSATYMNETAKASVRKLISGSLAPVFWIGLVLFGIVVPLMVSLLSYGDVHVASGVLLFAIVCEIIGGLSLRYCLLKGGAYAPLIITNRVKHETGKGSQG
jgi:formate-dependent nitrite reductase membrane component NrfD